jgi:hypothetical protein
MPTFCWPLWRYWTAAPEKRIRVGPEKLLDELKAVRCGAAETKAEPPYRGRCYNLEIKVISRASRSIRISMGIKIIAKRPRDGPTSDVSADHFKCGKEERRKV